MLHVHRPLVCLAALLLLAAASAAAKSPPATPQGGGADEITVGPAVGSVVAGASVSLPIRVRDLSGTPLGVDQAAGQRIQGFAIRINYPSGALSAGNIAPAGITGPLSELFGPTSSFNATFTNYVAAYDETSNFVPFTLDAAAPGDLVATFDITISPSRAPGPLALTFDAVTELSNQGGTTAENSGNGGLVRFDTTLTITSNAAGGLFAQPTGSTTVQLTWVDPDLVETGFRVQRSTDGTNFTNVTDLGPDVESFLDTGRLAGTLYYYRIVTLVGAQTAGNSNRATATTFPTTTANVCISAPTVSRRWARSPDAAFRGPEWGLVYHARDDGTREQVFFQRLDGITLAALGPRVQVSTTATSATNPAIAFNGTHYAVTWFESLAGAPGSFPASGFRFAQLDASGTVLRQPRRFNSPPPSVGNVGFNAYARPHWDGTHWGLFFGEKSAVFESTLTYRRLEADGDLVLGPTPIDNAPSGALTAPAAAWQPAASEFGVVWLFDQDATTQLRFQRVDEATGAPVLGAPAVLDTIVDGSGIAGTDLVATPGGGWLAVWSACNDTLGECRTYSRRIAADGTPDVGGRVTVSGPGVVELRPRVVTRPGGYAVFTESSVAPEEIVRYHLDATGTPDGFGPTSVSSADARASARPRVASDGARALALWNESLTTMEVAGRLSDGATGTLGVEVAFTSGHHPANTGGVVVPGGQRMVPLAGGFASVWQEPVSGSNLLHGRVHFAVGGIQDLTPVSGTMNAGRPGVASVGGQFAIGWRANSTLRYKRYSSFGGVLTAETQLLTVTGNGNTELAWDGENYAAVYDQGSTMRYVRVSEAGTVVSNVTLALGLTSGTSEYKVAWMGDGYALVLRLNSDRQLYYARFASDGTILLPLTALTTAGPAPNGTGDIGLVYNGVDLGVMWSETRGLDPPGSDIYFTTLLRNGAKGFPEVALVQSPADDDQAELHYGSGRFHIVYVTDNQGLAGLREVDIDLVPGGAVVAGGRFLANRATKAATAHDGTRLGITWRAPTVNDMHFETDSCLVDPSPPPCPTVTIASLANNVRLSWSGVTDPQSGLWRYHVYRNGNLLAELPAAAVLFDDSGYDSPFLHTYSVRGFNRAFQESASCPVLSFSTLVGDANGDGFVNPLDVIYLINALLSNGPAPIGDADANADGVVSVGDIFYLINFLFGGGPPPTSITTRSVS